MAPGEPCWTDTPACAKGPCSHPGKHVPTSVGCEKGKITTEENSGSELREDFVEGTLFGERRNSRAVAQGVLVRLVREGR